MRTWTRRHRHRRVQSVARTHDAIVRYVACLACCMGRQTAAAALATISVPEVCKSLRIMMHRWLVVRRWLFVIRTSNQPSHDRSGLWCWPVCSPSHRHPGHGTPSQRAATRPSSTATPLVIRRPTCQLKLQISERYQHQQQRVAVETTVHGTWCAEVVSSRWLLPRSGRVWTDPVVACRPR